MKLVTRKGQLDLPDDFRLTMERTNPLLSGEGDASVPVTLPASARNLSVLGHRERTDRVERYLEKEDAILQAGPVQKRGQLVMDTAHRHKGIEASFAINSSDLYVQAKGKTLKAIFESWRGGLGMVEQFASVAAAIPFMQACYEGTNSRDYTVFPVVVSPYETKETVNGQEVTTKHYQYNNEVDGSGNLVWQARTVMEGDVVMSVPDGYGIAPFLKLHKMIERLFQCLHYEVTENCFAESPLSDLVIVHNCADCLVTPVLHYADMAPSCTLSEFLEWLLAKFHAQPVVDSERKTVRVVLMEDVLSGTADMDLSGMVEGDWTVQMNPTKRIVLTPKGMGDDDSEAGANQEDEKETLENLTKAAGKTLNGLVKKYGSYVAVNEDEWDTLTGQNAAYWDRLVLRLTTGEFFVSNRNLLTGTQKMKRLGTNHFAYDRYNSSETEEHTQDDVMPLMTVGLRGKRDVAPYIGERLHWHTSAGKAEDTDGQCIMVAWRAYNTRYHWKTTGTTQSHIPYATAGFGAGDDLAFSLTNEGMYRLFWAQWNTLLLNNAARLKGRLKCSIGEVLTMDMSTLKLCGGRLLLPEKASATIGDKAGLTEAEFILAADYLDGVEDEEIAPDTGNGLKWSVSDDGEEVARTLFAQHKSEIEASYSSGSIEATATQTGYLVDPETSNMNFGIPVTLGETRSFAAAATVTLEYSITFEDHQGGEPPVPISGSTPYPGETVTFTITAVSA